MTTRNIPSYRAATTWAQNIQTHLGEQKIKKQLTLPLSSSALTFTSETTSSNAMKKGGDEMQQAQGAGR